MARYYKPVDPATLLGGGAQRHRGLSRPARGDESGHSAGLHHRRSLPRRERDRSRRRAGGRALRHARADDGPRVEHDRGGARHLATIRTRCFFPPAEYKKFVSFLDGRPAAGIGAELDVDPQTRAVRVADIFPDSPAESAGLQAGDVLTSIDGRTPPATALAVGAALRGKPGTTVRIGFERDGARSEVAIVRRIVTAPTSPVARSARSATCGCARSVRSRPLNWTRCSRSCTRQTCARTCSTSARTRRLS